MRLLTPIRSISGISEKASASRPDGGSEKRSGWTFDRSAWRYFDPVTHEAATGLFKPVGSSLWYHADSAGALSTGWVDQGGDRYYANPEGDLVSGFRNIRGVWYFFDPSKRGGPLVKGTVFKYAGDTHSADSKGAVAHDRFASVSGCDRWADRAGHLSSERFVSERGSRFILKENGSRALGWVRVSDKTYYADPNSGGSLAGGAYRIGEDRYSFDPASNQLVTGWNTLGGKRCYSMSSGVIIVESARAFSDPVSASWAWNGGSRTVGSLLGFSWETLVHHLVSRQGDYLGTEYKYDWPSPTTYRTGPWWSDGKHSYESHSFNGYSGYGMNCAGFLARLYCDLGAENSSFMQSWWDSHRWHWANSSTLRDTLVSFGAKYYVFDSESKMYASGVLERGDIIQLKSRSGRDDHVAMFWGDTSHQDKVWHSIFYNGVNGTGENMVSRLTGKGTTALYYVIKFS